MKGGAFEMLPGAVAVAVVRSVYVYMHVHVRGFLFSSTSCNYRCFLPPHAVEGTLEHNRDISTSLIINRDVRARTSP